MSWVWVELSDFLDEVLRNETQGGSATYQEHTISLLYNQRTLGLAYTTRSQYTQLAHFSHMSCLSGKTLLLR